MALFVTKCQHCQKDITLDDQWAGLQVNCPICNGVITVSKPAAVQQAPQVTPVQAAGGAASSRMKLQIKKSEGNTQQPMGANQFLFECPECHCRAVLPMNMFNQFYSCTCCKHTAKAGVFAVGRENLRLYSKGAETRVNVSTKADILKDAKVVIIMLIVMGTLAFPFYFVFKFSNALDTKSGSNGAASSSSGGNGAVQVGKKIVPAEIGGRTGRNRTEMLNQRKDVIEKCQDNNISDESKARMLKNLIENYPELKNDAEIRELRSIYDKDYQG